MLKNKLFSRKDAVDYALEYAINKNPQYFDYTNSGGNCTNYISQCLYAGTKTMNYNKNDGWFYISPSNTSISWANVEPFYNFLTTNKGVGPFASDSTLEIVEIGDIIQLKFSNTLVFSHSLIITKIDERTPDGIFICANTKDVKNVPLSHYNYKEYRLIHILGYRVNE